MEYNFEPKCQGDVTKIKWKRNMIKMWYDFLIKSLYGFIYWTNSANKTNQKQWKVNDGSKYACRNFRDDVKHHMTKY
jgi:hypothetical protein